MIRVNITVKENFSGESRKPGAITVTIAGEKTMPKRHIAPTTIRMNVKVIFTSLFASPSPCFRRYSVNTGIKAEDMDPSAKSSLRRLGILNAAKKVSENPLAPKYSAKIISLAYPRILLINVAMDMRPAAFAMCFFPSRFSPSFFVRIIAKRREEFAKYSRGYLKSTMGILQEIVARKKDRLREIKGRSNMEALKSKIRDVKPSRNFASSIKRPAGEKIRLISEIKKASPSKGVIRKNFDLLSIAEIYESKEVSAVSVLTEADYFMGNLAFLPEVKKVFTRPVLRKDFIFDEFQIYESRAYEADAILLIAAILERNQAAEYRQLAEELGMSVLFEVHDPEELDLAMMIGADIIGINNRNLGTLSIDTNTSLRLKREIPHGRITVSESGIRVREDVGMLEDAGFDAMLIGTVLMESGDVGKKINELTGTNG